MFKYFKNRGLGQKFEQVFYSYLHENNTTVFTTKEKYDAGKKEFILYIVFLDGTYEFLNDKIVPKQGRTHQYISEVFYSNLGKKDRNFYFFHPISVNTLFNENHPLIKGRKKDVTDERGVRLLYANKNNDQH